MKMRIIKKYVRFLSIFSRFVLFASLLCIYLAITILSEQHEILSNFRSSGGNSGLGGVLPPGIDFNNLADSDLQNLLNNMNQSQLMQIFGGKFSFN